MHKISYDAEYFNPDDVLNCGQIFRFVPFERGYKVFSGGLACYLYSDGATTFIECEEPNYFYNFFDLGRDYAAVNKKIEGLGVPVLADAANRCKGLRLLRQNAEETLFSFIISQNNNIPRIKLIIERLCLRLGEKRTFMGEDYYSFPTAAHLAQKDAAFFKSLGAGYRDVFLADTAKRVAAEGLADLQNLCAADLRKRLLTYKGVGPKVADCIALFGFYKGESFPVDTWIEKLYREDFNGRERSRDKINCFFTSLFGEHSGLVQQYLFYYKRSLENNK